MKYRLKDQELQKKLDEISGGSFTEYLESVKKPSCIVFLARNNGPAMSVMLTRTDIEPFTKYNPNDWNSFPEVTPPEGVPMRVEVEYESFSNIYKLCATFKEGIWYRENGQPIDFYVNAKVKRFRPWE